MSGGDDNVFARWSRRKRAARQDGFAGKAPGPTAPEAGTSAAPVEAEPAKAQPAEAEPAKAEPVDGEPANAEPVEGEPTEALPRIEDLHADSDLSAFLRKGVPAALKNTALRKMWSLDPVIRDYVGPAEYAWDFNTPGSMAGFGPLEANSAVVDFLSTVGRSVLSDRQEAPTTTDVSAAAQPAGPDDAFPSGGQESVETGPAAEAEALDAPTAAEPTPVQSDPPPEAAAETTSSEKAESAPEPVRPRHGSALPR